MKVKDLSTLRNFQAVAQLEHMTKAANALHISQPNLSTSIKRLEMELDLPLFERRNSHIFLNEYGSVYLDAVNQALQILEAAENRLDEMKRAKESRRVQIASTMQNYNENMISAYIARHPDSNFSVSQNVTGVEGIISGFYSKELTFAFLQETELPPVVSWTGLLTCRIGVLMSKQHRLAASRSLTLTDLAGEHFICNNLGINRSLTTKYLGGAGLSPTIVLESNDSNIVGQWIDQGYGISLISSFDTVQLFSTFAPEVTVIPIDDPSLQLSLGIARRTDQVYSDTERQLYEFAVHYFTDLGSTTEEFWQRYLQKNQNTQKGCPSF